MIRKSMIVGSSNGLICCGVIIDSENKHFLRYLNPSTRLESMSPCFRHPLPRYDNCFTVFGFGYDHVSDTYKTVGVYCNPNAKRFELKTSVRVYTLGLDTFWRKMQSFPAFIRFSYGCDGRFGKFVSGTLNWPAAKPNGKQVIVSVDLVNETCGVVSLPNVVLGDFEFVEKPSLCVLGDCLCYCYEMNENRFVLWQMKEYGVAESWTKLLNITYQGLDAGVANHIHYTPTPIFMLDSGEVLLEVDHCIFILCNPNDNSLRYLDFDYWILFKGITHIETLVSPFQTGG